MTSWSQWGPCPKSHHARPGALFCHLSDPQVDLSLDMTYHIQRYMLGIRHLQAGKAQYIAIHMDDLMEMDNLNGILH